MGQYYVLINLDKRQALSPLSCFASRFSNGYKLVEQLFNLGLKPMLALLLCSEELLRGRTKLNNQWGTWAGDRVVLIGDYSEDIPSFLTAEEQEELGEWNGLFSLASDKYRLLDNDGIFKGAEDLSFSPNDHHVIANVTAKEYLDPAAFGNSPPVLTSFFLNQEGVMKALFSC